MILLVHSLVGMDLSVILKYYYDRQLFVVAGFVVVMRIAVVVDNMELEAVVMVVDMAVALVVGMVVALALALAVDMALVVVDSLFVA